MIANHPTGACRICRTNHASGQPCPPAETRTEAHARRARAVAVNAKRPVDRTRTLLDPYDDTELPEGDQA